MDRVNHIRFAREAVEAYQRRSQSGDEHAIADLICDLGLMADFVGLDFEKEVERALGHWRAERVGVVADAGAEAA
jgi:hypothetical protein